MAASPSTAWRAHAVTQIQRGGFRSARARELVIDALAGRSCCASAQELADELRADGATVGIATIYRALELLDRLGLVHRLDVGDGTARYEAAHPDGDHHHHVVCDRCGTVAQFEDAALEEAIHALARRLDHSVSSHDVVLRGTCPTCRV